MHILKEQNVTNGDVRTQMKEGYGKRAYVNTTLEYLEATKEG
jgi:hypothetical protein